MRMIRWKTSRAAWEKSCKLTITKGKHTLKLFSKGYFPHVVSLRFECPAEYGIRCLSHSAPVSFPTAVCAADGGQSVPSL